MKATAARVPSRGARDARPPYNRLRLRFLLQLDQKTGREKAVLRKTIAALERRLSQAGGGPPPPDLRHGQATACGKSARPSNTAFKAGIKLWEKKNDQ